MTLEQASTILEAINVQNVSELDDLPNDVGGLTAAQLKAVFDKGNVDLKAFLLDLIAAIIDGDEAAARGITQTGMPGSMIQDGTIAAEKLISVEGAESVTTDVIRQYAITESKLSIELQTKLSDMLASIAANRGGLSGANASISLLQNSVNVLNTSKQNKHKTIPVQLSANQTSWTNVAANGVTPSNTVFIAPDFSSAEIASKSRILCSGQGTNTLSFVAKKAPTAAVTMNVCIFD